MYKLTQTTSVLRLADGVYVPQPLPGEVAVDWQAYEAWVADGGIPEAADPVAPVSPQEQIDALERQYMLPRVAREFMLTLMEAEAKARAPSYGMTEEQALAYLRAQNTGYRKAKELDEQIRALRELI